MLPAMRWLAMGRHLRGTPIDVFGWTMERRTERELAAHYASMVRALLPKLSAANLSVATQIANVPDRIRGYGHVKLASIAAARARWRELEARFTAGGTGDEVALQPTATERVGVQ